MARRKRPLKNAAELSAVMLSRILRIIDKLEKEKAIDRLLKMLTKVERSVDSLEQLKKFISNTQLLSEAFSNKPKKKRAKKYV